MIEAMLHLNFEASCHLAHSCHCSDSTIFKLDMLKDLMDLMDLNYVLSFHL